MSIQSTIELTRREAEEQLVQKLLNEKYKRLAWVEAVSLSNKDLEDALDETFHNYIIIE